jgi:hypothetical protein
LMLLQKHYGSLIDDYDINKLEQGYVELTAKLEHSADRLQKKPLALAKVESFTLGGEGLHLLAKDPYLPAELQSPRNRERLWQTMLRYDDLGRSIWSPEQGSMPTSITSFG